YREALIRQSRRADWYSCLKAERRRAMSLAASHEYPLRRLGLIRRGGVLFTDSFSDGPRERLRRGAVQARDVVWLLCRARGISLRRARACPCACAISHALLS